MGGCQVLRFFVCEDAGLCYESHAERDLEREARTAAFGDIDGEFGVLPEFELVLRHVEIAAGDLAKPDVARSDDELTLRIAHRRGPVTTSARLMEHQLAVFCAELLDDFGRFDRNIDSGNVPHNKRDEKGSGKWKNFYK